MKRLGVVVAGACLAGGTIGCTDGGVRPAVEHESEAIIGGVPSVPADDAVVVFTSVNSFATNSCSGSLIAPDVLLTALHCVSEYDSTLTFTCKSDGSLTASSQGGELGATVRPSNVSVKSGAIAGGVVAHGTAIYTTNSPTVCRDDIAVVVLDGPVPIGDAPLVTMRLDRSTKRGESVRALGYGETASDTQDPGRHERDGLTILGVGAPTSAVAGDPGVAPRTVMIGEGPCKGDSGGPLLSEETGAQIGVYSLISTNTCQGADVRNTYTQLAPYESLIRSALSSVGEEPLIEVAPTVGSGGEGGATGQAGEPNEGGAPGEAGAPPASTGGSGAGGSAARGGSGGSGGTGAVSGTGGDPPTGDDTSEAGAESTGSGSRRDASCAGRTGPAHDSGAWSVLGFALIGLPFLRRRRRT